MFSFADYRTSSKTIGPFKRPDTLARATTKNSCIQQSRPTTDLIPDPNIFLIYLGPFLRQKLHNR